MSTALKDAKNFTEDEIRGIGPRVRCYLNGHIFESFKTLHLPESTLPATVHVSVKWTIAGREVTGEALQEQHGSTLSISGPEICKLATDTLAGFPLAIEEESEDATPQQSAKRKRDSDCEDNVLVNVLTKSLLDGWEEFIQKLIYAANEPGTHGTTWKEEELRRLLDTYKRCKLDGDGNVVATPTSTNDYDGIFERYISNVVNKK